jgi:hypothetical protein
MTGFKTNAELRRFLMLQRKTYSECPERVWDRYSIYVHCVGFDECPKTLHDWLGD